MEFLILSSLLYAINNLVWKHSLSVSNLWLIMSSRAFLTSIIGALFVYFFYFDAFLSMSTSVCIYVVSASVLGALGLFCMVLALRKGTLFQLGVFNLLIVFWIASYLYVFEDISLENYELSTFLILVGFLCYIAQIKNDNKHGFSYRQLLLFSLMSLSFSVSSLLHWYGLKQSLPAMVSVTIQEFVVFVMVSLGLLFKPSVLPLNIRLQLKSSWPYVVLMAVIIFAAVWTGFTGLQSTNPLMSALISLITPISTIVLGILFYKDRWNYFIILSLLFIASGVYMLNLNTLYQ